MGGGLCEPPQKKAKIEPDSAGKPKPVDKDDFEADSEESDGDDFDDMPAPGDAAKLGVGMRVTPEPARAPGWLARRLPVALRRPGSWQHDADA